MSIKKEIYENLRYRIITNELRAGQQLYEKRLMEEYGIGRPSTYASIMSTLVRRFYVELDQRRFKPTDTGRVV